MPFAIGAATTPGTGFAVDVPPQDGGDGTNFGLTLQFESNEVPLGAADATILNFGDGIAAVRVGDRVTVTSAPALQFESNEVPLGAADATILNFGDGIAAVRVGQQVTATVTSTPDAEIVHDITPDGTTDNQAALIAALSPEGSFFAGNKVRARFPQGGVIATGTFFLHPSVSLPEDARGAQVFAPIDDLPPWPSGIDEDEAFMVLARDTPLTSTTLAWQTTIRGINFDARGTTQTGSHHGILVPNPDPGKSPFGDPNYSGNKDYTSPQLENLDIIGWPGSGISIQAGNGRFHAHSVRSLNNGIHGFDLGGNDVVFSGHWAAGGNDGFGIKLGKTSGFYAWGGNLWSNPATRGLTGGALWISEKNYFIIGGSELNDWFRADGGDNYDAGGTIGLCAMHPHAVNYSADGVLLATAGSDGSEQSNGRVIEYQSFNLMWNHSFRTDRVGDEEAPFPTPGNFGGDITGKLGTAPPVLYDFSIGGHTDAAVNWCEAFCTLPDVKPWTSLAQSITLIDSGTVNGNAVLRFTCVAHGLEDNHRVGFYKTGSGPTGLVVTSQEHYAHPLTNDTFTVSLDPITNSTPDLLPFISAGSGSLTFHNLSTRPFKQDKSNRVNYIHMDARWGLTRIGADGPATTGYHSHFAWGLSETDDINPDYDWEGGDQAAGRGALYGFTEFQNGVRYRDDAWIATQTADAGHRDIKEGEPFHIFNSATVDGITYTVNLPVDCDASFEWFIQFTGKTIGTLNWGVVGGSGSAGSIATTGIQPPTSSPGIMTVRGFYRRDSNKHFILSIAADASGAAMGRLDGLGMGTGVVGEHQRVFVAAASAVSLTTATPTVTSSITLQPGTWTIEATPVFNAKTGTVTPTEMQWALNVSTAGAAFPAVKDEAYGGRQMAAFSSTTLYAVERCFTDVNLAVATTYNIVQEITYTGAGTAGGSGSIVAYRRG